MPAFTGTAEAGHCPGLRRAGLSSEVAINATVIS
jgi:hypothetical protein